MKKIIATLLASLLGLTSYAKSPSADPSSAKKTAKHHAVAAKKKPVKAAAGAHGKNKKHVMVRRAKSKPRTAPKG